MYNIGFLMEQNAGHLTNYRNLRAVVEDSGGGELRADWHEIAYMRPGGGIERMRERLPFVPSYLTGNARMLTEYRRGVKSRHYDAVFSNSWAAMFAIGQMKRVPTLLDFDSTPRQIDRMPDYGSPHDPTAVAKLKYRLCQRMYRSATLLQAWSTWARDSVIEEYGIEPQKVIVNPPGVDLEFFRPPAGARDTARRPVRVLFVGADFHRKGGDLLLDWVARQVHGAVELHLVTRDPGPAGHGVTVHSGVTANSRQLLHLYQTSDVFVLPSRGECFGLATVEAMATGLPVIASDAGGTRDIVETGGNGFITRAGHPGDLDAALKALVFEPELRRRMGARSRQIAESTFDARRNARRTLDALCAMAAGGAPI